MKFAIFNRPCSFSLMWKKRNCPNAKMQLQMNAQLPFSLVCIFGICWPNTAAFFFLCVRRSLPCAYFTVELFFRAVSHVTMALCLDLRSCECSDTAIRFVFFSHSWFTLLSKTEHFQKCFEIWKFCWRQGPHSSFPFNVVFFPRLDIVIHFSVRDALCGVRSVCFSFVYQIVCLSGRKCDTAI